MTSDYDERRPVVRIGKDLFVVGVAERYPRAHARPLSDYILEVGFGVAYSRRSGKYVGRVLGTGVTENLVGHDVYQSIQRLLAGQLHQVELGALERLGEVRAALDFAVESLHQDAGRALVDAPEGADQCRSAGVQKSSNET